MHKTDMPYCNVTGHLPGLIAAYVFLTAATTL